MLHLPAEAQGITERPPRSGEAVEALRNAQWRELEPGLWHIDVTSPLGTRMLGLRVSADRFTFDVAAQENPGGEFVRKVARREGAAIVTNGGFFSTDASGNLKPVGLLLVGGKSASRAWTEDGGFLVVAEGQLRIVPTPAGLPAGTTEAIQTKPVLIESGGRWAMRQNLQLMENRTLVCLRPGGETVILMIAGGGLSLYEAGWLLRSPSWGGWFDCDSAIALDGGGSSQLFYDADPEVGVSGVTPVQNFLMVRRKEG